MVTMAKSPRTGATRTLTWIARIHSRTYINTVTTAWCEAPAQLLVFSACWVFSCFRNPANSDMYYRIFIVRTWSFSYVRVHNTPYTSVATLVLSKRALSVVSVFIYSAIYWFLLSAYIEHSCRHFEISMFCSFNQYLRKDNTLPIWRGYRPVSPHLCNSGLYR